MQLSQLICKEVAREPGDDDQASVLSYFIHTAKVSINMLLSSFLCARIIILTCSQSCLDLKNFEAVFAIMKGLQSKTVQQAETPWHVRNTTCTLLHTAASVVPPSFSGLPCM